MSFHVIQNILEPQWSLGIMISFLELNIYAPFLPVVVAYERTYLVPDLHILLLDYLLGSLIFIIEVPSLLRVY
jgi:hypothetical protein